MTWLRSVIENPVTERVIAALIIINAITLGLETSATVMAQLSGVLHIIDRAILTVFVLELAARMLLQRGRFFRDGWNIFDFLVIGVSLAPATEGFAVLRALRVLRLLRLITVVPSIRRVVGGLIGALPGLSSIVLLIGLIYYVCAVMAVNLFGEDFPELFGTLPASLFTLFTIMTLEGWVEGVVKPIMAKFPYAWLFFIPFIIGTTFTILNLFIGIIVTSMQTEYAKEQAAERIAEHEMIEEETQPLHDEMRRLRDDIAALREEVRANFKARSG